MRTALALLPLLPHLLVFAVARAQKGEPFLATVSMTRKVLAVGECSAVSLDLKDASGKGWPRGPNGASVSMADFDLSVSAPAERAAVGKYDGATSFAVCAGTAGTTAQPASRCALAPRERRRSQITCQPTGHRKPVSIARSCARTAPCVTWPHLIPGTLHHGRISRITAR